MKDSPFHVVDVAHPPPSPGTLETILDEAAAYVRLTTGKRILKVVHGYGSRGNGGLIREEVRNWAYRRRTRFRLVLEGEEYSMFNSAVQEMRREVGSYADTDLQQSNPGITILWIR